MSVAQVIYAQMIGGWLVEWMGKDINGNSCILIWGTILEFAWKELVKWVKLRISGLQAEILIHNLNDKQECYSLDLDIQCYKCNEGTNSPLSTVNNI